MCSKKIPTPSAVSTPISRRLRCPVCTLPGMDDADAIELLCGVDVTCQPGTGGYTCGEESGAIDRPWWSAMDTSDSCSPHRVCSCQFVYSFELIPTSITIAKQRVLTVSLRGRLIITVCITATNPFQP